jgi:hypothetical protein
MLGNISKERMINRFIIKIKFSVFLSQAFFEEKGGYRNRISLSVRLHYQMGIWSHLTVNRIKENNRIHSVTIK